MRRNKRLILRTLVDIAANNDKERPAITQRKDIVGPSQGKNSFNDWRRVNTVQVCRRFGFLVLFLFLGLYAYNDEALFL